MRSSCAALVFLLLLNTGARAQTIEGRLLESGSDEPIILAQVFLLTGGGVIVDRTFTDEEGSFAVWSPEPGSFFLRAERMGYASRVDGVFDLGEGGILSVEFRLPRAPIQLDTLTVSAEGGAAGPRDTKLALLGFYDRQRAGFGRFLGPEEIARRPVFEATDLLRNIPRVRIRQRPFGETEVLIQGAASVSLKGGLCYPKVVVDGNEVFRGGDQPARLDDVVRPHEISAMEVYRGPGEIPLQFGGASSPCGVILIWTW
ncbi:MAG: carboxypeptidase regulatory-like domain-containing protein [Longimicrobiales bacterium]